MRASAGVEELARDVVRVIDAPGLRHVLTRQINCGVLPVGITEETVGLARGIRIKTHNLAAVIYACGDSSSDAIGRVDSDEGAIGLADEPMTHEGSVHIVADNFPMGVDAEQARD